MFGEDSLSNVRGLFEQDKMMFDVPRGDPYTTLPEKSRYDCRIAISNHFESRLDDEMILTFNGGRYVILLIMSYSLVLSVVIMLNISTKCTPPMLSKI